MSKYNKIVLASKMFIEAHNKFDSAKSEMDYVSSILLSGAVVGIVAPLLEEQGGHPMHEILARISNVMVSEGYEKAHQGIFRETYNAFKHAGNKRKKIKPTEDLEIETDIKIEAGRMLDIAKSDFKQIEVSHNIRSQISNEFIQLLESEREYA
jgi:hypothetical protein